MRSFTTDIPGTPASAWDRFIGGLPPLNPPERVVVLAAHPDDETLGVGGITASAREATVVIASDGAGSHPGSPTHSPAQLAALRRAEASRAVAALGARAIFLDLPDGGLASRVATISGALADLLQPGVVLLSTWLHDGHPDHEACAAAARRIAAATGTRLLEYPLWAWWWADPDGADLAGPLRRVDLSPSAAAAKAAAIACYRSQTGPLSEHASDRAVLPESFLANFGRTVEVVLDIAEAPAGEPCYFEALYDAAADPWQLADSWYEQRKRTLVQAVLPRRRFGRAFEPGCGPGLLSAELARRCDVLVAADASAAAVAHARTRVSDVRQLRVPQQWPQGRFDLVVLCEVAYYVADLAALADRLRSTLEPDAVVVLCHWRHPALDHPHDAGTVHEVLRELTRLHRIVHHVEEDFLLDVLATDPRSVATREGIV